MRFNISIKYYTSMKNIAALNIRKILSISQKYFQRNVKVIRHSNANIHHTARISN